MAESFKFPTAVNLTLAGCRVTDKGVYFNNEDRGESRKAMPAVQITGGQEVAYFSNRPLQRRQRKQAVQICTAWIRNDGSDIGSEDFAEANGGMTVLQVLDAACERNSPQIKQLREILVQRASRDTFHSDKSTTEFQTSLAIDVILNNIPHADQLSQIRAADALAWKHWSSSSIAGVLQTPSLRPTLQSKVEPAHSLIKVKVPTRVRCTGFCGPTDLWSTPACTCSLEDKVQIIGLYKKQPMSLAVFRTRLMSRDTLEIGIYATESWRMSDRIGIVWRLNDLVF